MLAMWESIPKDLWELFIKVMPILPSDIVLCVPSDPKLLSVILLCRGWPPVCHAVMVTPDYKWITANPGDGCQHISGWGGDHLLYIVIRKRHVTPLGMITALAKIYLVPCNYDWINYYVGWTQFLIDCVCPNCNFPRLPPDWWWLLGGMECISNVAFAWDFENHQNIRPNEMVNHPDWRITCILPAN